MQKARAHQAQAHQAQANGHATKVRRLGGQSVRDIQIVMFLGRRRVQAHQAAHQAQAHQAQVHQGADYNDHDDYHHYYLEDQICSMLFVQMMNA